MSIKPKLTHKRCYKPCPDDIVKQGLCGCNNKILNTNQMENKIPTAEEFA